MTIVIFRTFPSCLAFVSHALRNKSHYRVNNYLCLIEYFPLCVHLNRCILSPLTATLRYKQTRYCNEQF